jgi:thiol-disulfide isomerase/thioredoxin
MKIRLHQRLLRLGIAALITGAQIAPLRADPAQSPLTGKAAPAIASGTWINTAPQTIQDQHGKVTVLCFWTHLCINCKRTIPFWNAWAKEYRGKDVAVISVHTPETDSERQIAHVRSFVQERGLAFPVVTDNDEKTWDAYGIRSWPTTILIDKQGRVRYQFEGELNWEGSGEYRTVHALIEKLRAE